MIDIQLQRRDEAVEARMAADAAKDAGRTIRSTAAMIEREALKTVATGESALFETARGATSIAGRALDRLAGMIAGALDFMAGPKPAPTREERRAQEEAARRALSGQPWIEHSSEPLRRPGSMTCCSRSAASGKKTCGWPRPSAPRRRRKPISAVMNMTERASTNESSAETDSTRTVRDTVRGSKQQPKAGIGGAIRQLFRQAGKALTRRDPAPTRKSRRRRR